MNGVDPSLASEDVVTGQDMGVGTPFMSQTYVYLPPPISAMCACPPFPVSDPAS